MEKTMKVVPFGLLIAYLTKALIFGTTLNEVLLSAILAGLTVYFDVRLQSKQSKVLEDRMKTLEDTHSAQNKIIEDVKNNIASIKTAAGFRGLQAK